MRFLTSSAIAFASWIIVISTYTASAAAQDHDAIAQRLHSYIVENVKGYTNNTNSKALVGCINWQTSIPDDLNILYLHWSHTAEGSGGQIFVTQLMQSTLNDCNKNRKNAEIDCQCVPIDKNGRSVLKVPDSFIKTFPDSLGAVQEREDLSKSEIDVISTEGMRASAPMPEIWTSRGARSCVSWASPRHSA